MRKEERIAAGSLYMAQRRDIPEPDIIDIGSGFLMRVLCEDEEICNLVQRATKRDVVSYAGR